MQMKAVWVSGISVVVAVLLIAAAGAIVAQPARATGAASPTVIRTERTYEWGTVLAAADGHVLYAFENSRPHRSAPGWRPLLAAGGATAAKRSAVMRKLLGTTRLADGKRQATYARRAL
jgi:predicted lipoprotein with Yx(FWY)xxD motif